MGGMEQYVESQPELAEAFKEQGRDLCCMDERTAKGMLNVPGSGILLEGDDAQTEYRKRLHDAGVEGVYSHDGCGAAKQYAKEHGIEDYNAAAIAYAQDLAAKLGVAYRGHLKTSGDHPGRVVYYDTTGRVNRGSRIWQEKMPTGFGISRNVLSAQEAMDALVLAVKISFGEHGYRPKSFTEEDPLSLIFVADPADERTTGGELERELEACYQAILKEVPEAEGKIRIEGFPAPPIEEKEAEAA